MAAAWIWHQAGAEIERARQKFEAAKRDVTREESLDASGLGVVAHQPSPSQWAIAAERWDGLVRALVDHVSGG